ncbi:KIN14B-interacting protein At4g14310-like [Phragmites australis]|uniref:KIN14B-interacting protein At4g14310-like n=1 Tax=Phragmites australis TaxID=29695 RepID=UPI002D7753AB|nr:KIN14B-interacting protein At4g14310-like [Phragmites australis]
MSSRLKDRGGGGKVTATAAASRPLTPKPFSITSSARRPTAAGKENSASKPTSAVRRSTSSIPRASRIPSSVESSKLVSSLRASLLPGRASIGRDPVAEAGLRRSASGGIRASSVEKGRRSVSAVGSRASEARRGSGGAGGDVIDRRREGFDAKAKGFEEVSRKRDGFDAKAKQTDEIGRKRESFDAKAKQIIGKRDSFGVNVAKQCDEIKGKTEIFDADVKKQTEEIGGRIEGFDSKAKAGDEISRKKEGLDRKLVREIQPKKADSVEASSKAAASSATQKDGEVGNGSAIPVFTVHVVDSNDAPIGVREQQKSNDQYNKQEEKEKLADKIRVFEKAAASGEGRPAKVVSAVNKYPSKLHEKLAALEGRVQKIATEIKKTKEMLDENNPDEPKQILSNIQKEITAIEKAISHVKVDNKIQLGTADSSDCESSQVKRAAKCTVVKPVDPKHAGKGVNTDELEARFFPHHKLLRDRRSSTCTQQESSMDMKKDSNGKTGPSASDPDDDENSIAMEFLASLDGEENGFFKDRRAKNLENKMISEVADATSKTSSQGSSKNPVGPNHEEIELLATEKPEEFDEQENKSSMMVQEETEESSNDQLSGIGNKSSTGGWFVSEGEAVLLAHGDGTCSYYDIANHEFKSEYKPPSMISNNMWGDCWLIRAPGVDGCSGRYVVAASAGNALETGFCSWDYYTREVKAFHIDEGASHASAPSRAVLGPLSNVGSSRSISVLPNVERQQWWYKPCGPLLLSTASKQKMVTAYDIRDGDVVMQWEVSNPVMEMEYSSPLQWRSRGKVVIADSESIGLWDVNSLNPEPLLSVASSGKKVYCLHVNNTDAEVGGGVRQRVSSSEVEGNDGVFSTQENVNVFDFRVPAGIGLKIARHGGTANSIFSRGDSVFIGSTESRLQIKGRLRSRVQQYSLRKGKLVATYELPEFNAHFHHSSITQVWGNSNLVLAACGMGLFAFDTFKEDMQPTYIFGRGNTIGVREVIGPDDLYCPTFDYSSSRVLLVSRDRRAHWRYLS